ncbi:Uncharacterised protein [Mycobacteroides abscessus subsp. abscessus]|nr:Uncharacterised protein [Mycobacteroides abscessus subsp. abscessus]
MVRPSDMLSCNQFDTCPPTLRLTEIDRVSGRVGDDEIE